MARNFDLAALVPKDEDRPTYTDYDLETREPLGVYTSLLRMDFSPLDLIRLEGLYNAALSLSSENGKQQSDKMKAKRLDSAYGSLFKMLIPDLPQARRDAVPFMVRRAFVLWWHEEMDSYEERGENGHSGELEGMTDEELANLGEETAN